MELIPQGDLTNSNATPVAKNLTWAILCTGARGLTLVVGEGKTEAGAWADIDGSTPSPSQMRAYARKGWFSKQVSRDELEDLLANY